MLWLHADAQIKRKLEQASFKQAVDFGQEPKQPRLPASYSFEESLIVRFNRFGTGFNVLLSLFFIKAR